jgi:hypothetical protein
VLGSLELGSDFDRNAEQPMTDNRQTDLTASPQRHSAVRRALSTVLLPAALVGFLATLCVVGWDIGQDRTSKLSDWLGKSKASRDG